MFFHMLLYDLSQSCRCFGVWAAASLGFAAVARFGWFSLTDMPLFYLMFFSAVAILLFRYYNTMYGHEASFLFTIAVTPAAQVIMRFLSAAIWCCVTTLFIGAALWVQGEEIAALLFQLSPVSKLLLYLEVFLSQYLFTVSAFLVVTLANQMLCKNHRILWACLWTCVICIISQALTNATGALIPQYVVVNANNGIFLSTTQKTASSIAFSVNACLWQMLGVLICIGIVYYTVKKKLLVNGS